MRALHSLVLGVLLAATLLSAADADEVGSTRVESYYVNTTIESRFARTDIVVNFQNERNCSALRGFTLQLPLNARVNSFVMILSDGCEITSKVAAEKEAKESFETKVAEGKPAALLTAWDSTNYRMEVSIPPSGKTRLEVHFEELLRRRLHKVEFQVPMSPGVDVDSLVVDVSVSEPQSGVSKFFLDDPGYGNFEVARTDSAATAHLEVSDVSSDALPRLLRGSYDSGVMTENGILMADGYGCATLLFDPSTFLGNGPMPRNIVFVIDVSGSMSGQKLSDAKAAFSSMIETLSTEDHFAIHSFSGAGTQALFAPSQATSGAKLDAISFVNGLSARGGTNLNDAFLDGLDRVKGMQAENEQGSQYVPVVVILTDGQATSGVTGNQEISRAVRDKNEDVNAKIFALAFGWGADLPLLLGISVQNGGHAVPIYEGFGDAADQMEGFFQGELGTVLMVDVRVSFGGDFDVLAQTEPMLPVFADGSEIVARAMMAGGDHSEGILQATTTARTAAGTKVWTAELEMGTVVPSPNSECQQGLAHARIAQIMQFRQGALSLGEEMKGYEPFQGGQSDSSTSLADQAEEEALRLALEAGLVWPGLTAMVTVESSTCEATQDVNEVCTDGDGLDSASNNDDVEHDSASQAGSPGGSSSNPPPAADPNYESSSDSTNGRPKDADNGEGASNTGVWYDGAGAGLSLNFIVFAVSILLAFGLSMG